MTSKFDFASFPFVATIYFDAIGVSSGFKTSCFFTVLLVVTAAIVVSYVSLIFLFTARPVGIWLTAWCHIISIFTFTVATFIVIIVEYAFHCTSFRQLGKSFSRTILCVVFTALNTARFFKLPC